MALAARLKELRVRSKKSLQDVATEVGASKQHIWDLETGRATNPGLDLLTKLSRSLNVSVADLIGENPEGADEPSELVALYRDLKKLSPDDQQLIQNMTQSFIKRSTDQS